MPKAAGAIADHWNPKYKSELASAVLGAQCTQAREANVPAFNIVDTRCQLCHEATGTLQHRFTCTTTCPTEGWPVPPPDVGDVVALLPGARKRHLQLHGLLAVRFEVPPFQQDGSFCCIVTPLDDTHTRNDTTWYCDSSLLHGRWKAIRYQVQRLRHFRCHR